MFLIFLNVLITVLIWLIFIRVILSWVAPTSENPIVSFVTDVTNLILLPIQRLLPKTGFLDFSPLVALILLDLIKYAINMYLQCFVILRKFLRRRTYFRILSVILVNPDLSGCIQNLYFVMLNIHYRSYHRIISASNQILKPASPVGGRVQNDREVIGLSI